MSTATLNLARPVTISKPDPRDWTRELWHAAHAMARRMIRDRAGHGTGAAYVWYLGHARNASGPRAGGSPRPRATPSSTGAPSATPPRAASPPSSARAWSGAPADPVLAT